MSSNFSFSKQYKNLFSRVEVSNGSGPFLKGRMCKMLNDGKVSCSENLIGGYPFGYITKNSIKLEKVLVITAGEVEHSKIVPFIPGEEVWCNSEGVIFGITSDSIDTSPTLEDPDGMYRKIGRALTPSSFLLSSKLQSIPKFASNGDIFFDEDSEIDLQSKTGVVRGDLSIDSDTEVTVRSGIRDSWAILEVQGDLTLAENSKLKLVRTFLYVKGDLIASPGSIVYSPNGGDGGRGGDGGTPAGNPHIRDFPDFVDDDDLDKYIDGNIGSSGGSLPIEYGISGGIGKGGGGAGGNLFHPNGGDGFGGGGALGYNSTVFPNVSAIGGQGLGDFGNGGSAALNRNGENGKFPLGGGSGTGNNPAINTVVYSGGIGGQGDESQINGEVPALVSGPKYLGVANHGSRALAISNKAGNGGRTVEVQSLITQENSSSPGAGGGGGAGGGNAEDIVVSNDLIETRFAFAGGGAAGQPGSPTGGCHLAVLILGSIGSNVLFRSGKGGLRAERSYGGKNSYLFDGDLSYTFVNVGDGADSSITSHGTTGNIYLWSTTSPELSSIDVEATPAGVYDDGLTTPEVDSRGGSFIFNEDPDFPILGSQILTSRLINKVLGFLNYFSKQTIGIE